MANPLVSFDMPVRSTLAWAAAAVLAVMVPLVGTAYAVDVYFQICSLVMVAISWNLMAGAGLISLGHSAFFGLGAYAAILSANKLGFPLVVSLVPAMVAGSLVGAALALITGRLRGIYFAICTLATSEGLRVLAVMLPDVTGGANGLYLDSTMFPGMTMVNIVAALGAVAAALVAALIGASRSHYALRAMRNNEAVSQMLGIEPIRYRLGIMAVSGALASFAGAISLWRGGYLDPGVAFDLTVTIDSQIAPILGGIYTQPGPIIGSIATIGLMRAMRFWLGDMVGASLLVFGLVLVVSVLWLPNGLYGAWRARGRSRRRPTPLAPAP
jgi:branched-chain amino acid transport system permease protein